MDMLRTSPRPRIHELAQQPVDFLFVYQGLVLQAFSKDVAFIMKMLNVHGERVGSPERLYVELGWLDMSISTALVNTRNFAREHQVAGSKEMLNVVTELENSSLQSAKTKDLLEKHMQRQVASLSLVESRKSIQMTNSVTLLTRLAFVFIPLSFSTSLFGINVRELGTGTVSISAFVGTAIAVTGSTFLVWWFAGYLTDRMRTVWGFVMRLSLNSPWLALILAAFLLFGQHIQDHGTLVSLSAQDELLHWIDKDFRGQSLFEARFITRSKAWQARLCPVQDFVNNRDWRSDYAFPRWLRSYRAVFGSS